LDVKAIFRSAVCSNKCPQKGDKVECKSTTTVKDCSNIVAQYNTKEVIGYCFPSSLDDLSQEMKYGWK